MLMHTTLAGCGALWLRGRGISHSYRAWQWGQGQLAIFRWNFFGEKKWDSLGQQCFLEDSALTQLGSGRCLRFRTGMSRQTWNSWVQPSCNSLQWLMLHLFVKKDTQIHDPSACSARSKLPQHPQTPETLGMLTNLQSSSFIALKISYFY